MLKVSPEGLAEQRTAQRISEALCLEGYMGATDACLRATAASLVQHGIVVVIGTPLLRQNPFVCPLDRCYPIENSELKRRIAREQFLISQFPVGHPVAPKNFPIRNRTIAQLTDATVIVEAGLNSGPQLQGWEALRLGGLLFLLESVANDSMLSWPKDLIRTAPRSCHDGT